MGQVGLDFGEKFFFAFGFDGVEVFLEVERLQCSWKWLQEFDAIYEVNDGN